MEISREQLIYLVTKVRTDTFRSDKPYCAEDTVDEFIESINGYEPTREPLSENKEVKVCKCKHYESTRLVLGNGRIICTKCGKRKP